MASPAPSYADGLVVVDQPLTHALVSHVAHVTFGLDNVGTSNTQTIADDFQDAFNSAWTSLLDTDVTIEKPIIKLGDGSDVPFVAVASGPTVAGTNDIDVPAPQTSVLIKKITALGGRRNRGRTYFPWIVGETGITEAGRLFGDIITNGQTAADAFLAALVTNETPMCIVNRTILDNPTPPPAKYVAAFTIGEAVQQYNLEDVVATQRRRLVRS
jgi:hypothetical protein